jgi:hydroxymethylglutaryl-CoA lyase
MASQSFPERVRVVEVGPRDGLQNETALLTTDDKTRLIEMLAEAGLTDIEVSSFVNPQRVPQLADASEVFARLRRRSGTRYWALVPNRRGLQRAFEAGVDCIAVFTAASETFNQRNIGMTIAESLDVFREIIPAAHANGCRVRAYLSTAFVCPYEGLIAPAQVVPIAQSLAAFEIEEISIGDTLGHATPDHVARLTEALLTVLPRERFAYHFHDTRRTALANVECALRYGIATFDSSVGGTGGCPFASGAAGNLATEELLALLHRLGIETGVDAQQVAMAARFLTAKLGRAPELFA